MSHSLNTIAVSQNQLHILTCLSGHETMQAIFFIKVKNGCCEVCYLKGSRTEILQLVYSF